MDSVTFVVHEDPVAQPRPKARRIGPGIQIYTPQNKRVKGYKKAVADAFIKRVEELDIIDLDITRPISILVVFCFCRPQSLLKADLTTAEMTHVKKPDVDNLLKSVMDALNGVAWTDDSQVTTAVTSKKYAKVVLGGKSGRKRLSDSSYIEITVEYQDFDIPY